jgi:hypothetical protein
MKQLQASESVFYIPTPFKHGHALKLLTELGLMNGEIYTGEHDILIDHKRISIFF